VEITDTFAGFMSGLNLRGLILKLFGKSHPWLRQVALPGAHRFYAKDGGCSF
jgi:hypothetical protein